MSSCYGSQALPTLTPPVEPTQIPPIQFPLQDSELIASPSNTITCDHGDGATIECAQNSTSMQIKVNTNASTFARWSMQLRQNKQPLTGDETLLVRASFSSKAIHNLYLVEESGRRIGIQLNLFRLDYDPESFAIPLREFKDDTGSLLDFAAIREIQLVFEYADIQEDFQLESLRLATVWRESKQISQESIAMSKALTLPVGFVAEPIADHLFQATQLNFTVNGDLLASVQNGRIWRYSNPDSNGIYQQRQLFASGFEEIVSVLYDPSDGTVWTGGRGKLYNLFDTDGNGVADQYRLLVDGLPWGRHQNNGLAWNPDPDPFTGETGVSWIYFGLGSTEDLKVGGDLNAKILRFPRTGTNAADLQVVSRGNRNAYKVVWAQVPVDLSQPDGKKAWQLFASENGPDFNDAPDEVNHIRWQHDYGFPDQFGPVAEGKVDGEPYSGPVYPVEAHASASGLAYVTNPEWPAAYRTLYVGLFGEIFGSGVAGHTVDRIQLTEVETPSGKTYRGNPDLFIQGIDRPLAMTTDLQGNLLVADYATGVLYRIRYVGSE